MRLILGIGEAIFALFANALFYASALFYGISFLAGLILIVMLPWDFLVWLFNADWRTSEFRVPMISFGVSIVCGLVSAAFDKGSGLFSAAQSWCSARQ